MNKRILKLFNEAGFHQPEMERLGIEDKFEKFAELIVKECVKVMYDDAIERKVPPDINQTPMHYVVAVLKHFGVEE